MSAAKLLLQKQLKS